MHLVSLRKTGATLTHMTSRSFAAKRTPAGPTVGEGFLQPSARVLHAPAIPTSRPGVSGGMGTRPLTAEATFNNILSRSNSIVSRNDTSQGSTVLTERE
jgi:hypothetical protein